MKKPDLLRILIFLPLVLLAVIPVSNAYAAASITIRGNWARTVNKYDLMGGAGTDLNSNYDSSNDQVTADITLATGPWRVNVRKSSLTWHGNLQLLIRRSSDGTGEGSISGGSNFQELTDTDMVFFEGSMERYNTGMQLRLTGMSVQVPPANYTTTIYLTIVETQ